MLPSGTAYRRGLCVSCQQVSPAAGMPRCWPCHSDYTGMRMPVKERRQALIRGMAGTRPPLAVLAIAIAVADFLLAVADAGAGVQR
jgi:hypothetical protein